MRKLIKYTLGLPILIYLTINKSLRTLYYATIDCNYRITYFLTDMKHLWLD